LYLTSNFAASPASALPANPEKATNAAVRIAVNNLPGPTFFTMFGLAPATDIRAACFGKQRRL